MKRKVIQLSEKTLVVSLPTFWVRDQNIKKGSELDVSFQDNYLLLGFGSDKSFSKTVEINAKNISERVLRWQVSSYHKQGYDEIVVTNYSPKHFDIITDLVTHLFVGFIIKEQSAIRIKIGSVAQVDATEFDSTLRRTFRLLDSVFGDLYLSFKNQDQTLLSKMIVHEHVNNQLTNFCETLLNRNLKQKEKGHFWYVIAWNLEKIVDNPKYIANYYKDKSLKVSDKTLALLEKVHKFAVSWYDWFYKFSFETLVDISNKKKELSQTCHELLVSEPENDKVLINYLHMVILQLADFSASTIAIKSKE